MAFNQISNNCGMLHYTSGGQFKVPIVIRGPGGVGKQLGAEHSQRLESYFQARFPPHAADISRPGFLARLPRRPHGDVLCCLLRKGASAVPSLFGSPLVTRALLPLAFAVHPRRAAGGVQHGGELEGSDQVGHPVGQPHHLLRARAPLQREGDSQGPRPLPEPRARRGEGQRVGLCAGGGLSWTDVGLPRSCCRVSRTWRDVLHRRWLS